MDDLISRQAAIELIERMKPYHQNADDIAEMIANMPSVESEIAKEIEKDCTEVMEGAVRIAKALAEVLESIWRKDDAEIH